MTDITELAQSLKAAAEKATPGEWVVQLGDEIYATDDGVDFEQVAIATLDARDADYIALANPANILALVEALENSDSRLHEVAVACATAEQALEKAQQSPVMPLGLHPDTKKLVTNFCTALAEKLYKAQLKYGYDTDWKQDGWTSQCQAHFHQHIAKGDPRDVAAYCAFMWWHGWSTKPAEVLEARTVKLPHPTDFDDHLSAYEAIEKCKDALTAAGIKVEAE